MLSVVSYRRFRVAQRPSLGIAADAFSLATDSASDVPGFQFSSSAPCWNTARMASSSALAAMSSRLSSRQFSSQAFGGSSAEPRAAANPRLTSQVVGGSAFFVRLLLLLMEYLT